MTGKTKDNKGRRSLITGMGVAAAGMALGTSAAKAQDSSGFRPARHGLDAWLDELPGSHRVFIDTSSAVAGAEGLLYANNIYTAQENAYAGSIEDYAMIVCFRHSSTPFGYTDTIWERYGEVFHDIMKFADPSTGGAPRINLMNAPDRTNLPNFGNTIDMLAAKGTVFAICNHATRMIAGMVAARMNLPTEKVYEEFRGAAVPNSRFVPAGVTALTRAQEYGYSLLVAG